MTFEERMERIAERHESLAQAVELMASMHRDSDARIERRHAALADLVVALHRENADELARTKERTARNEESMRQLTETMNRLANIVISHDERLDDLENGRK